MGQVTISKFIETIDDFVECEIDIKDTNRLIELAETSLKEMASVMETLKNDPERYAIVLDMSNNMKKRKEVSEAHVVEVNKVKTKLEEYLNGVVSSGLSAPFIEMALELLKGKIKILEENNELKNNKIKDNPQDEMLINLYTNDIEKNNYKIEVYKSYLDFLRGLHIVPKNPDEPSGLGGL